MDHSFTSALVLLLLVLDPLGSIPILLLSVPVGMQAPWASLDVWAWAGLFWSVLVSACSILIYYSS